MLWSELSLRCSKQQQHIENHLHAFEGDDEEVSSRLSDQNYAIENSSERFTALEAISIFRA